MKLTSQNYTTSLIFQNTNWFISNINAKHYLVVGIVSNFTIEFSDEEDDPVYLKSTQNDQISMYSKLSSTSNKTYDVLMQTETSTDNLVSIYFQYTDKYHQDLSYWKNFSIGLNLFIADPPIFESKLNDLKMSRCSSYEYQLPQIIDPNGYSWNLTLDPLTPDWIVNTGNTFIKIDPPLIPNDFEENFEVKLKLENEVRAWNNYSFNVMLEPYFVPQLNVSGKIKFSLLDNSVELNVNSKKEINVVYWDSNTIISWLKFDKAKSILIKCKQVIKQNMIKLIYLIFYRPRNKCITSLLQTSIIWFLRQHLLFW